ncbi:F0F1 ATP synthase subunit delta [Streptococcus loxodontisalivarius]|uniref:ATP synthase subunit delta n=1 Tax=Streptococcus loxodontisalivarius TaxID=1349415 RepID=A0ABS2PRH3_9STRE|nr:F0F1 ATP synthase subunit delta [Streptococcus loxodontisalivarius]MBM7642150.1 F-type H+-transporting ATPase subunit delta [Streptococcus loxodontisalivarius]
MDKKTLALIEQYAKSLAEVAVEKDAVSDIYEEISQLLAIFKETNLTAFLSQDAYATADQLALVRLLQESCSAYLKNFLEVILQNERQALLEAILVDVQERLNQVTGSYKVHVTTAVPLTASQKERISDLVLQKFAVKTRELVEEVDESILGGFVIKTQNKIIDTSIKTQLQQLKMNLK